jgi:hypothetical protein
VIVVSSRSRSKPALRRGIVELVETLHLKDATLAWLRAYSARQGPDA